MPQNTDLHLEVLTPAEIEADHRAYRIDLACAASAGLLIGRLLSRTSTVRSGR